MDDKIRDLEREIRQWGILGDIELSGALCKQYLRAGRKEDARCLLGCIIGQRNDDSKIAELFKDAAEDIPVYTLPGLSCNNRPVTAEYAKETEWVNPGLAVNQVLTCNDRGDDCKWGGFLNAKNFVEALPILAHLPYHRSLNFRRLFDSAVRLGTSVEVSSDGDKSVTHHSDMTLDGNVTRCRISRDLFVPMGAYGWFPPQFESQAWSQHLFGMCVEKNLAH